MTSINHRVAGQTGSQASIFKHYRQFQKYISIEVPEPKIKNTIYKSLSCNDHKMNIQNDFQIKFWDQ